LTSHVQVHCQKNIYFQDLLSQPFFLSQINLNNLFSSDVLMLKSISFIVLTHFFQFNQLKILRQPSYFIF